MTPIKCDLGNLVEMSLRMVEDIESAIKKGDEKLRDKIISESKHTLKLFQKLCEKKNANR